MILYLKNIFLIIILGFSSIIGFYQVNLLVLNDDDEFNDIKKAKISLLLSSNIITIYSNDDFIKLSNLYNWSGNGTEKSPFIIKNYNLQLNNRSLIGINIQNTNLHFRIENVTITGAYSGILLNNVSNVYVINNTMTNSVRGFNFINISNTKIEQNLAKSNLFTGFEFHYSDGENLILNNNAINNSYGFNIMDFESGKFQSNLALENSKMAFRLFDSNENYFVNNTVSKNEKGFGLFFSNGNNFLNNSAVFNEDGFFLESDSNFNVFSNNTALKNKYHGFTINWGNHNDFKFNIANNNEYHGFAVYYGNFNNFLSNYASLNLGSGYFLDNITQNNNLTRNLSCGNKNNFNDQSQKNIFGNNIEENTCNSITTPIQGSSNQDTTTGNRSVSFGSFLYSIFFITLGVPFILKLRKKKNPKK